MSLRLSRRGKIFYVRGTVRGQTVFETTGTSDRARAEAFRAKREGQLWDRSVFGERATVPFVEAAIAYIEARKPGTGDTRRVERLAEHFRGVNLRQIDQNAVDRAIKVLCSAKAKPGTHLRSVIIPLTAVLIFAAKRGWCERPTFDRPRQPKGRTVWLTPANAIRLRDAASEHLRPLIVFLLCTGARVAEALDLTWDDVDLARRTCALRETKNGKDRIVHLPPAAVAAIANLEGRKGAVFRRPDGEPYTDREREEGGQFKSAWKTACRRAGLGRWEKAATTHPALEMSAESRPFSPIIWRPLLTPHALRHTWATWYYLVTQDALRLMHKGGWSGLALVERYAHLSTSEILPDIALIWGGSHPDQWERTALVSNGTHGAGISASSVQRVVGS
jgi:integrase